MAHLSRTDVEAALAYAALLNQQVVASQVADERLLASLAGLVDFEVGVYSHIDDATRSVLGWAAHQSLPEQDLDTSDERLEELSWTANPFCLYRQRTGDWSAVRYDDVVDLRRHSRSEYFVLMAEQSKRAFGTPTYYVLQMWVPTLEGSHRLLNLVRTGRNFGVRDRLLLNVMRPHLAGYELRRARQRLPDKVPLVPSDARLTAREEEVLDLVAAGATNAQISERLWISPDTVRKHLENVYLKLGVGSHTAALARTGRSRSTAERTAP